MKVLTLFCAVVLFLQCGSNNIVKPTNQIDREIILVNIGDRDRTFIGNLLLSINNYKPLLIAVDGWFFKEKDQFQDSVLLNAFKIIPNDILAYILDSSGKPLKSHTKFTSLVTDEGLAVVEKENGLSSSFIPVKTIEGQIHEHFSLKILKRWKANLKYNFKADESIPIEFSRGLEQFFHFDGTEIQNIDSTILRNKIVFLGYLGPTDEDKHFTPMRYWKKDSNDKPDTYGLVIVANQISTIMNYTGN